MQMNDIYLSSRSLRAHPPMRVNGFNNGGLLYRYDDDLLIKIYGLSSSYLLDNLKYNVDTLLKIGPIDNVVMPLCRVYVDGEFKGICMDAISKAKNLYDVIENPNITLKTRINYAKKLVNALRNLHMNNVIIGDMHLDNIVLNSESIYLVDMDSARCKEDILLPSLYYLQPSINDPYIRIEDKNTDNIKMAIIASCLMYGVNFEEPIRNKKISHYIMDDVRKCLPSNLKESYTYPINMDEYFRTLLNQIDGGNYERDRSKIMGLKDISRAR